MTYDFSNLTMDECKGLIALARTRMRELVKRNPICWVIKKVDGSGRKPDRFLTAVPGKGWRQCMALTLDDYWLRVFSSESWANEMRDALQEGLPNLSQLKDTTYVPVPLRKEDLPGLNCWPRLQEREYLQKPI